MAQRKKKTIAFMARIEKNKLKYSMNAIKRNNYLKSMAKKMERKKTWPEKEFEKMLKEIGVVYMSQKIVGKKIYDYYIPSVNMLIEVDGDYYHANPDVFEETNRMQKRNIKNDKYKNTLAVGLGYLIERVWEHELKYNYNNTKKKFKKILL